MIPGGFRLKTALFISLLLLLAGLAVALSFAGDSRQEASPRIGGPPEAPYVEGEVLVKFKPGISPGTAAVLAATVDADGGRPFRRLSGPRQGQYLLLRSQRLGTRELLDALRDLPEVEAVSPNYRRRLQRLPNDPKYAKLWGMAKIQAPEAWERNTGSSDVVLAVIDTGVHYGHEDLAANMWRNQGETPGNGIDDDNNGFRDDVFGFDFAADRWGNNDSDPMDIDGHGTHVAGTMAAVGNNGTGVCGINWKARIMALKGFRPDMHIYDSDCIEAIDYAVMMKRDRGVNVAAINASFGGGGRNPLQEEAIADAASLGIAFVCAAGNEGADNDSTPFFPANYDLPGIISVAASDQNDGLASFSNYGASSVDIAAPGVAILSTVPPGQGQEAWLKSGSDVFDAAPLEYSGTTSAAGLSRLLYDCGLGRSASDFPAAVSGQLALIERGEITFEQKALNAQAAGAVGVAIYNSATGDMSGWTLNTQRDWVPVVSLSRADGLLVRSRGVHAVNLTNRPGSYGLSSGTSMATPHVCGAMGLMAAHFPGDDLAKRIGRLFSGADRVTALDGKMIYGARLNLARALAQSVVLTMTVSRRQASAWLVEKDYAEVHFSVEKDPGSAISGETYTVYRKIPGNSYQPLKEIAANEIQGNSYTLLDKYLERGSSYSYVVQARSAQGDLLALSNELTI
jgi:subtilisin family serine protease